MRALDRAVVFLLGALTLGGFGLALVVWWFGRRDRPADAEVIIVLGARVSPDGSPSRVLVRRVERAAGLLRSGTGRLLLVSGGSPDGRPTEASVMARLLLALGVASSTVLLEEHSRTTAENARRSTALLRERGLGRATVVSDRFHLLRARQLFRLAGQEVGTVGADPGEMPTSDRVYWVLREALALLIRPALLFARPVRP